jgi:isoleucyl-tRNA synthetase
MGFEDVANTVDFVALEHEMLRWWRQTRAFEELRALRHDSPKRWSFLDGPITANNPMGVHHAWGRTYKDLYQRFKAMQGHNQRWQNGFDCQGLWVEVNVEKDLGFTSKRDIEAYGLAEFVKLCKMRVLEFSAIQTQQTVRLGNWMDWNEPDELLRLRTLLDDDPQQQVTIQGAHGPVTSTVEDIVGRLGMPDIGGSYFTFSNENNYQIWSFLKTCHERGWLYKGRDVMPWCARCGTGISQHEIVTDGYRDITHDTVYLKFPLRERLQEALLVWTTTPWTLTSNVAAAIGPHLAYVKVKQQEDGWTYYLAQNAMQRVLKGQYEVVGELSGADLLGWTYEGPFDTLPVVQQAFASAAPYQHRTIAWKDVSEAEGTGIVHIAPGCGAEDFQLSQEHNLPIIAPLDENGYYLDGFDWLSGQAVASVGPAIVDHLRRHGLLYRTQRYSHRYPTCWRCAEELVFRLVDEWFISMGKLYDKPRQEVSTDEKNASLRYQIMDVVDHITWYPSFGYDREQDWLRNMHDWMISKKRYWGLALPIWECHACGHFEVMGSEHELQERAVEGWDVFAGHTPHRPYIDAVKIACGQCGSLCTRVTDVGNPWLDAGIVAFSTLHYRDDPAYWEQWFPADFITESFPGQFRNWFYSLLAQSTALVKRPPFKNVLGFATLLAEDGREMHKSWGNAIEFNQAVDTMGADVMRWVYASHRPEQNLLFGYALGDEVRRRVFIKLWNVYSLLVTYAKLDGWEPLGQGAQIQGRVFPAPPQSPTPAHAELDRWIIERVHETTLEVTKQLEQFSAARATVALEALLEDLSNWYVRRSRRRFWKGEADEDKVAAYVTLYSVLVDMIKLMAPFAPFVTEAMYQNLVRNVDPAAPSSVHHCDWPTADAAQLDRGLLDKMRLAITVAALGRSARNAANLKLRQPLAKARVHVGSAQERTDLEEVASMLLDELNVRSIEVVSEIGELVDYKLMPNSRVLGPKFGKLFPQIRTALAGLDPVKAAITLQAGESLTFDVNGTTASLGGEDVIIQTESRGGLAVSSDRGVTVAVDTELTAELIREGYARDIVRVLNTLRKDAGLALNDRIHVQYEAGAETAAALRDFATYIQQETLALSLEPGITAAAAHQHRFSVGDSEMTVAFSPAR